MKLRISQLSWFRQRSERGAGLVEYSLVVALIAVVSVSAVTAAGGSVADLLTTRQ